MRKVVDTLSIICLIVTLASIFMGVKVLLSGGTFASLALFSMAKKGTFMGFIGNLMGIAVTCGGFGAMGINGLRAYKDANAKRNAFIWGIAMSILCIISVICSVFAKTFNFGDILITILPIAYTLGIFKMD